MKKITNSLMAMLAIVLVFTGCSAQEEESVSVVGGALTRIEVEYSAEDLDGTWQEKDATKITFHGSTYTIEGEGASVLGKVLTISEGGTYLLTGTLNDGQILVEAGEEEMVQLVLNGASISSLEASAIYSIESEKTMITLAEDTVNSVTGSSACSNYEGKDEPDSAIYSKSDLTINGSGTLKVKGNYKDGITSKDDLVITGGIIEVSAINDGIKGKESIAVNDGTFSLNVKGDGLQSGNEEEAEKDGFLWMAVVLTSLQRRMGFRRELSCRRGMLKCQSCQEEEAPMTSLEKTRSLRKV